MSLTALAWLCLFVLLSAFAFVRPVYAVGIYMMTFFANPLYWWWGNDGQLWFTRWNLVAGIILLSVTVLHGNLFSAEQDENIQRTRKILILILINATLINFLLVSDLERSIDVWILLSKFVLLFFLITAVIRTRSDLNVAIVILTLGIGYWGYEATINERGRLQGGRLEGIGGPGARDANALASCVATALPLAGSLLFLGRRWEKTLVILLAPMALNVVILCNSRGTFLSLLLAAIVILVTARGRLRRKAIVGVTLGGIAAWMLLGDPQIVERFLTTFSSSEERDGSAQSRIDFWMVGLQFIADHPLGNGGDGFKEGGGADYLRQLGTYTIGEVRSVHNGYINEACEWGIQGALLRLAFMASAAWCAFRTMESRREAGDDTSAFFGSCVLAAIAAFMGTSLFGDYLDNEWGYWIAALCVAYARVYNPANCEEDEEFDGDESAVTDASEDFAPAAVG